VVKFKARGPYKCVTVNGHARTGMHPALFKAIGSGFDYNKAKATNTLQVVAMPPASEFYPLDEATKNTRTLAYSAKQGQRLDTQIGAVVKLHTGRDWKVPLRVFLHKETRDHFIRVKWQGCAGSIASDADAKKIKRLRNLCNSLMPETHQVIRYLDKHGLDPIETQVAVARGEVGTPIDLVCYRASTDEYISCELKTGCEKNYTHGKLMGPPFSGPLFAGYTKTGAYVALPTDTQEEKDASRESWRQGLCFTTHREHVLQNVMNSRLLRFTYPSRKVGVPLLLRADRQGLHVYRPPDWATKAELALAQRMGCA